MVDFNCFSINKEKYCEIARYSSLAGAIWIKVYEKSIICFPDPIKLGSRSVNFKPMLVSELPEMGLLKLTDGIVIGPNGWICNRDGYLLHEHSWYGIHSEEMDFPNRSYKITKLSGSCLSLTSDWSNINYGHFLLDGLSRLNLFLFAGYSLSDVDHFYCPSNTDSAKRLLDKFNIPITKCINPEENIVIMADLLLAPSFPGIRRVYPSWVPSFLKQVIQKNKSRPHRCLYIPRHTTRKIQNESSLISIALRHDFEIFDPLESKNPALIFSESKIIVSAHGSALADIAFCTPGTTILELIPSDHVFPYWYTLASAVGMQYYYLVGESNSERKTIKGPSPFDFNINEEDFKLALKTILQNQSC